MTEREFNAFIHHLEELVRTKKSNEQIVVDIYNDRGKLVSSSLSDNDNECFGYKIIGGYLFD